MQMIRYLASLFTALALATCAAHPAAAQSFQGGSGGGASQLSVEPSAITATGSLSVWNRYYEVNCASDCTITLPPIVAPGNVGQEIRIKVISNGSQVVTLAGGGGATFSAVDPALSLQSGVTYTITAKSPTEARVTGTVANSAGSVRGEQMFTATPQQATMTTVGNGQFTINDLGAYRICYFMGYTPTELNETVNYRLHNITTGVEVPNTRTAVGNSGINGHIDQSATMCTFVAVTTPTIFAVQGQGNATELVWQPGTYNAKVTWERLATSVPVVGQSVDYVLATTNTTSQVANGDFSVVSTLAGNIPVVGNAFQLTAGKTYNLEATVQCFGGAGYMFFNWVDTSNNPLPGLRGGLCMSATATANNSHSPATVIFTPTVNMGVKLRAGNLLAANGVDPAQTSLKITQIGTSGITSGIAFPCQVVDFMATALPAGFVALNGQSVSSLTTTQQAVATGTCGMGANLPDARGRVVAGRNAEAMGSLAGSNSVTLAQNQLPNTGLSISSVTSTSGGSVNTDSSSSGASGFGMFEGGSSVSGYPATGGTSSINGGVTQQPINTTPASIYFTKAIYLGG